MGQDVTELLAPFCLLHGELAPCLACLLPEVFELVASRGNNKNELFYIFTEGYENVN